MNRAGTGLRTLFAMLLVAAIAGCSAERGAERDAQAVLVDEAGVAIGGYDVVAYFVENRPVAGSAEHAMKWNGANWWFSSAANRTAFAADPEAYAPAYGGWCAYGMAQGYAAETDPVNGWTIHEGRLYLNWDAEITADWRADKAGYLQRSEANWPDVRDQLGDGSATVYWHES